MSGPQFAHVQSFGRKANPGGQKVKQILGEAMRQAQYCHHVPRPKPPIVLLGISLAELEEYHDRMVEEASTTVRLKDGSTRTRAIREDRHTLGTFVASYPVARALIDADATGSERALYEDWKRLNLDFLQRRFGPQLKTVIEHTDEDFGHLHAFMLPDHRADVDARCFNPAYQAKRLVEAAGKKAGNPAIDALRAGNEAYKAAARDMVDEYYREVGAPAGLTRDGPRRRRLSRGQWQRERLDARDNARLIRQENEKAARTAQEARQRAEEGLEVVRALAARLEPLQGAVAALDAWEAEKEAAERDRTTPEPQDWDRASELVLFGAEDAFRAACTGTLYWEERDKVAETVGGLAFCALDPAQVEVRALLASHKLPCEAPLALGKALAQNLDLNFACQVMDAHGELIDETIQRDDPLPVRAYDELNRSLRKMRTARENKNLPWTWAGVRERVVYLCDRLPYGPGLRELVLSSIERGARNLRIARGGPLAPVPMPETAKPAAALPEPLRQTIRNAGPSGP